MMKTIFATALAAAAALSANPAFAKWALVGKGTVYKAVSAIAVTPGEDWNRNSSRPIKKSEVWSLDGVSLNELYFVSALLPGETLFKDVDKKERPLPKLPTGASLTDLPEFVESSMRIARNTSIFEMGMVSPAKLAGREAIRFTYTYAVSGETMKRKGLAMGTLVDGKLYLITFQAPETYYFDRDLPKAEAIVASAKF